ncbi:MAG: ORF6N domain-containing protein [Terriglobia bacterium]
MRFQIGTSSLSSLANCAAAYGTRIEEKRINLKSQIVTSKAIIPAERIERRILLIRGQKVMLDAHLAELYEVETKVLNRAVRRNIERFPEDFMFRLSASEFQNLRFQFGTSSWGGRRFRPYAFTEQGVAMLSSVLRSDRAVQVNIAIMRAFVKLHEMLASHRDLARKLEEMEKKYDAQFKVVFDAIRELMSPKTPPSHPIGFMAGKAKQR